MAHPDRPSLLLPILLVVVVLVAAGVGTGLLYEHNNVRSTTPIRVVQVGDNVTVNYIGYFGSGPQVGRVFDTSIYSVATNNLTWPKSLEFSYRGSEAAYSPLPVHVGPSAPSGGYTVGGLTFSSVVPGFWQGLLGLPVNTSQTVSVPPDLGYGSGNPGCLVLRPLTTTVPVTVTVPPANFTKSYPGTNATPGVVFVDPTYGWNDLILSANASAVVVENLPTVGWTVPGTGWPVVVTAVTTTTITVTNRLTLSDQGVVLGQGTAPSGCSGPKYIVSAVDPAAGTYTQDFNPEVDGQTLVFVVSVYEFY